MQVERRRDKIKRDIRQRVRQKDTDREFHTERDSQGDKQDI